MATAIRSSALHAHFVVQRAVEAALAPHGFAADAARAIWVRSLPGGVEHTVALPADIASDAGPLAVTANLGVHYLPLAERLSARHPGRAGRNLATFTRNVGQLSRRRAWRDWTIRDERDAPRVAARLAQVVRRLGLPWFDRYRTADDVSAGFRSYGHQDHHFVALPILERLLEEMETSGASEMPAAATDGRDDEPLILSLHGANDATTWRCDD